MGALPPCSLTMPDTVSSTNPLPTLAPPTLLAGKKALVVGVANGDSIATGCARAFRLCGADVALTYQNDKARPHVEPIAQEIGAEMLQIGRAHV